MKKLILISTVALAVIATAVILIGVFYAHQERTGRAKEPLM
jgi:hypothetical protein